MSEVTATGDAVAAITSGTTPANKRTNRKGRNPDPKKQAVWEAQNDESRRLWNAYFTAADREQARSRMAGALLAEVGKAALSAFRLKSAEGWKESATDQMRFEAEEFTQNTVIETIRKLDNGSFERGDDASSFNAFRGYVTEMKRQSNHRAQDALIVLNKFEPVLTAGPEDEDEAHPDSEGALFHKAAKSDSDYLTIASELIQLGVLQRQDPDNTKLIAAYSECRFDADETANRLGITTAAATKRLSRLKQGLKLSELEAVLQQIFGEKDYSKAAAAILPLIPAMTQRGTNEFPTMWAEAQTLKIRPRTRRVAQDRPKSNWHQSVRWLYRLWSRGTVSEVVPTAHNVPIADISPANCLKAFEDILCRYQEYRANSGGIQAIKYGRGAEVGKATHTTQIIKPSASDFTCDVTIAARRSLSEGEYAYFKMYYESADVAVEPEDKTCLQKHVDSFPESKRVAVASLDDKVRRKLGARLIQVGIYPFADYMKPLDTRRAKAVLPVVQACAESKPKGKLLSWPSEDTFDIQASEDTVFEPLLGVEEAAKLLCVHPKTLQALARSGTVPCTRMGKYWRFRASVLDAWVRDRLKLDHQSRRVS